MLLSENARHRNYNIPTVQYRYNLIGGSKASTAITRQVEIYMYALKTDRT